MATFTVTRYDDVVDPNDNQLSLREAVNWAIASSGDDTINLNQIAQLNQPIVINSNPGRITFQGNGTNSSGFSGQDRTQIVFVNQATVSFSNLGFYNSYIYGGDGQKGGGGGLGAGGALFINRGDVTADRVTFVANRAVGGKGGGRLRDGGDGGAALNSGTPGFAGGAGGRSLFGSAASTAGIRGAAGIYNNSSAIANGGNGGNGGNGNFGVGGASGGGGGGGEGGAGPIFAPGNGGNGGNGGAGGFGAGGGGGGGSGSGGGNTLGGAGSFNGRGGQGGAGGAFAAGGSNGGGLGDYSPPTGDGAAPFIGANGGAGGGGAGLGGAVFVREGGRFTVTNSSFIGNSATGGLGGNPSNRGLGWGGAIFVQSGGTLTHNNVTFTNNSAQDGDPNSNVYPVKVNRGDGTIVVEGFTGVGRGSNPSEEILSTFDELVFKGADLIAKNLLLTQIGADLEVSFEGVDDTKVILKDFALENLDNLPIPGGQHGQVGNIVFGDNPQLQDNIDVFDADSTQSQIWNRNTVTFLNDLDNDVRGFANSDDVINGQGGNDIIRALSGNDIVRGGDGDDHLYAGVGADILMGNAGDDTLYLGGDRNVDTVIYRSGDGSDRIDKFHRPSGDLLQFEGIAAIDVVVNGNSTSFRLGDGLEGNSGFGTGQLLAELRGVTGFTRDNIGLNLAAANTAQFLFA